MTGPKAGSDAFGVLGQRSEFVGREQELIALDRALERAQEGRIPQLVTVVGNQGTGKSRLFAEWLARLQDKQSYVRVFRGAAVPNAPEYGPFSRFLRERFAIRESEEQEAQLQFLRTALADVF